MNTKKKVLVIVSLGFLSVLGVMTMLGLSGCDGGECLAHGENCSSEYIDANYGGVRPPCCNSGDFCQSSGAYLTCN